jgi:MinD-like ATPase involved in chromosome partitioning or flagellar assembly
MPEPEIALVFSPDRWVEDLHRYCVDHGGARIRCIVMEPDVALEEDYGVLVVSHRWPGLTAGFVDAVHALGRRVLGVVDPAEPAAARHLELVRVDHIVASDTGPAELVAAVVAIAPDAAARRAPAPSAAAPEPHGRRDRGFVVIGGPAGGGRTEVAIELARAFAGNRSGSSLLVDADDVAPAVATRLALPIEPNLRSAIDAVEYGMGGLPAPVSSVTGRTFAVLAGLPNVAAWSQLRPNEVLDVVHAVTGAHDRVVVDIASSLENTVAGGRGRFAVGRALVERADVLIGVGAASPVGVVRLLAWAVDARALNSAAPVHLVVSRAPADRFRCGEIEAEIARTFPAATVTFAPADRRVERAGWEGDLVAAGPFTKSLAPLAAALAPLPSRGRSRAKSRRRMARTRRGLVAHVDEAVA